MSALVFVFMCIILQNNLAVRIIIATFAPESIYSASLKREESFLTVTL